MILTTWSQSTPKLVLIFKQMFSGCNSLIRRTPKTVFHRSFIAMRKPYSD